MRFMTTAAFITAFLALTCLPAKAQDAPQAQYAISLHGQPKYAADFKHQDYVNPDAPKGGTLRLADTGTFDSLNPFIVKGTPAAGLNYLRSGLYYESLMQNSYDEPFTLYGVVAQSITVADDKSWVIFNLRKEAKWHDGTPITAHDVIWTFNALTTQGQPFFKAYWHDVKEVTAENDHRVKFAFSVSGNAELPLIIAELPILPKHYWTAEGRDFSKTSLEIPLASGPYKISKVDAGKSIEFTRNPDWWGKDLAFFKGMYNFDKIIYDYYRDEDVEHEAFLAGAYDVKEETLQKRWEENYDIPALKSGKLIKEEIANHRPAGMQAFIYNIRRPIFSDVKVREALAYGLDFEWSNKQFAYGKYTRTNSYFENSELASSGMPSTEELAILENYRGKIPDQVFTQTYKAPVTDGSGKPRANLKQGIDLLVAAGFDKLGKDGIRYRIAADGKEERLSFEIVHFLNAYEKWVLPFVQNLKTMGVEAKFRIVDPTQYQNRMNEFDFDMTIGGFGQSESPGNEQREFWGSDKADIRGSRNYIGIKNPAIDDLVTQIIHAKSREDLVTKTRALDRILLWNHYVIPMWSYSKWRIAYWDKITRPQNLSGISPLIPYTWWSAEAETAPNKAAE